MVFPPFTRSNGRRFRDLFLSVFVSDMARGGGDRKKDRGLRNREGVAAAEAAGDDDDD